MGSGPGSGSGAAQVVALMRGNAAEAAGKRALYSGASRKGVSPGASSSRCSVTLAPPPVLRLSFLAIEWGQQPLPSGGVDKNCK